ncbi:MAG: hypothetical protein JNM79_08555 [Burkholderiales bacterium]|nr:hypothetical protein [Burkholderiales bacterium]
MAIDFEFDGKPLPPGARTTPRHSVTGGVDLTGSMEFHASDTPDIALGATTEVSHASVPDIELVATNEVDARAEGLTPSQLLGEGEHGHEATAVVDWASYSTPDFDPSAPPRTTVAPVVRARPAPTVSSPAPTVSSRPATRANPAVQTSRSAPPAPARTAALPQAPAADAAASDGVSDLQMLAGQVSVLTELVVAMLAAMPQRESVARLALRNAERLRDYPGAAGTNASWREGVVREIENLREVAAGLAARETRR